MWVQILLLFMYSIKGLVQKLTLIHNSCSVTESMNRYYKMVQMRYNSSNSGSRSSVSSSTPSHLVTYESGELAEPPGDIDRQHRAVALLQRQVR